MTSTLLTPSDAELDDFVALGRKIIADAPLFGTPENLAELESAKIDGDRFESLVMLPTDTSPN
jgi:hypothetical protein